LALSSTLLGILVVVGETGSRIVQGIDEKKRASSGRSSGKEVSNEPLEISVLVLGIAKEPLEIILEGEVERLRGEVSEDVGQVSSPESEDTLGPDHAGEAVDDAGVWLVQTA